MKKCVVQIQLEVGRSSPSIHTLYTLMISFSSNLANLEYYPF